MNVIKLRAFILLTLILNVITVSYGQGGPIPHLTGTISNEQDRKVESAAVSLLRGKDSTLVKGTLTNEMGIYNFENIKGGTYIIRVTAIGLRMTYSQVFDVQNNTEQLTIPEIKMSVLNKELKIVNIVASKPLIERKTDRMVVNVENSILAAGNNALEILERTPGVSLDKDDNISLKGKRGVTVMINDKLTYLSSTDLATLLRSTDGSSIQSIELITNPSAKYDASGTSGIINIKLKKNDNVGTNGNIVTGVAVGKNIRDNASFSLNHKAGKINMFVTYSRNDNKRLQDIKLDRIVRNDKGDETFFNQDTKTPFQNHNNSYRLGADYNTGKSNTLGFVVSGYFNSEHNLGHDRTVIGSVHGPIDSSLTTETDLHQTYQNFAVNIYDKFKLDTLGQMLSVDIDYSKVNNNSNAVYTNQFFLSDGMMQHPIQVLTNRTPTDIDIRTAKIDYVKPITKSLKLEFGGKYSNVKTDNNLQAQVLKDGKFVNDTTRTNHFVYDEKIAAGYADLTKNFNKTSVQIGLRSEYTRSNGNLIGSGPVIRHYFDFFPSAFISQILDEKNDIGLSYSRRIDRPAYNNLNPFVYYLDPLTFFQGNSFLNPQYTNSFEINYTYNKAINISVGYNHTTDLIAEIVLTSGNKSFDTQSNLQSQNYYNVGLYFPYSITKWWAGDVNFSGFYQRYRAEIADGGNFNHGKVAFQLKSTQTFTVGKFKGELMGTYNSATVYSIFNIKSNYGVDAGISHNFADKKINLKLSVTDIFDTRKTTTTSLFLNNNFVFNQKFDSRVGRITVLYNFGNSKLKTASRHTSGADDESGRVKKNT